MKRWYVCRTHARAEPLAVQHLERQGFTAYLPRYRKRRRHARRTDEVLAPLFPRYLFVSVDTAIERWRAIRSTFGVRELICCGEEPLAVPQAVIDEIRSRESADGTIQIDETPKFLPGDKVRVTEGAFSEHVGLFASITDEERVFVLLDLLGRLVKVRLPAATLAYA